MFLNQLHRLWDLWLIGSMLRCLWRTYVARNIVEERSELVKDMIAFRKDSPFYKRDPSSCKLGISN